MSCLGVHFAIDATVAARLLEAHDDDALVSIVKEEIEEQWREHDACETNKAWDALHRCLSDGTLDLNGGAPPLNLCFFGGRVLNEEPDYFVVLLTPEQVTQVADALRSVTQEWLRDRYASLDFPDHQGTKEDEDFEYTWGWFQGLPGFFSRAAENGRHVIFTVDQ